MPPAIGLCSYVLPESDCVRLYCPDEFWTTIEESAIVVDQLPGYTPEMMEMLIDWAYEWSSKEIPSGLEKKHSISDPMGAKLIGVFNSHDLRGLHTRFIKVTWPSPLPFSEVFECWNKSIEIPPRLDRDWIGFLTRQTDHISDNDSALVLVP